ASPPDDAQTDAVRVLTVHAAKGREFPVVYVPNLAEGRFPPRARPPATPLPPDLNARGNGIDMEEEPALLFVAMSRARDQLVRSDASALTQGITATVGWRRGRGSGSAVSAAEAVAFFRGWWEQHGGNHPYTAEVLAAGEAAVRNAAFLPRTLGAPTQFSAEVE